MKPEDKKPKLKPCPFCGSGKTRHVQVAIKYERDRYNRIKCDECGAYGPIALSESEAISMHNTRNSIPRRSEVDELLRLVGNACEGGQTTLDMAQSQNALRNYADKLRKEVMPSDTKESRRLSTTDTSTEGIAGAE